MQVSAKESLRAHNGSQLISTFQTPLGYAASFAALPGGNHSGTPTAIQQVLTNQPQGLSKQLPSQSGRHWGNINSIELLTTQSADYVFQNYIQTFAAVTHGQNSQMNFTGSLVSGDVNVLARGAVLTITLSSPASYGQGPFAVETERVDAPAHTISAVTLQGHPLAGWRYWRLYAIGTYDLVIETGAYDSPGPGPKNYIGYYLASGEDGMISAELALTFRRVI